MFQIPCVCKKSSLLSYSQRRKTKKNIYSKLTVIVLHYEIVGRYSPIMKQLLQIFLKSDIFLIRCVQSNVWKNFKQKTNDKLIQSGQQHLGLLHAADTRRQNLFNGFLPSIAHDRLKRRAYKKDATHFIFPPTLWPTMEYEQFAADFWQACRFCAMS